MSCYVMQLPSGLEMKAVKDLPSHVDWRETPNVVSAVKDQVCRHVCICVYRCIGCT